MAGRRRTRGRYQFTTRRRVAILKAQKASARKRKNALIGIGVLAGVSGAAYLGYRNRSTISRKVNDWRKAAKPEVKEKVRVGNAISVAHPSSTLPKRIKGVSTPQRVSNTVTRRVAGSSVPSMNRRVLVTGSRDWSDADAVNTVLDEQLREHGSLTIIHGGARGADSIADQWAKANKQVVEVFPAEWNKYGKAAGMKRNRTMAEAGADIAVAFPLGRSPGTRNMMKIADSFGIRVRNYGRS